jgi:hypothetical protein
VHAEAESISELGKIHISHSFDVRENTTAAKKRALRMNNAKRLRLLLQAFLLVLSSFLFSFLFSHWFLFSASSAQRNHHAQRVRIGN